MLMDLESRDLWISAVLKSTQRMIGTAVLVIAALVGTAAILVVCGTSTLIPPNTACADLQAADFSSFAESRGKLSGGAVAMLTGS